MEGNQCHPQAAQLTKTQEKHLVKLVKRWPSLSKSHKKVLTSTAMVVSGNQLQTLGRADLKL